MYYIKHHFNQYIYNINNHHHHPHIIIIISKMHRYLTKSIGILWQIQFSNKKEIKESCSFHSKFWMNSVNNVIYLLYTLITSSMLMPNASSGKVQFVIMSMPRSIYPLIKSNLFSKWSQLSIAVKHNAKFNHYLPYFSPQVIRNWSRSCNVLQQRKVTWIYQRSFQICSPAQYTVQHHQQAQLSHANDTICSTV